MKEEIERLLGSLGIEGREGEADALFSSLGFREPERSRKNLVPLLGTRFFDGAEAALIAAALDAPDPDLALNNLERIALDFASGGRNAAPFSPEYFKMLCTLAGGSAFLTAIALRRPELLERLVVGGEIEKATTLSEKTTEILKRLEGVQEIAALQKELRRFKAENYLRVGLRDLLGLAGVAEVMAEISDLAEACLEGAYSACSALVRKEYGRPIMDDGEGGATEAGLVILGMGKFGGRELNFSSDIDLIFFYSTERGETTGVETGDGTVKNRVSFHQYFVRLCKLVFKAMNDVTEDGFVFRVDMNLRPEGQSGDLACSLRSAEIYYESWGQTWERSAMLKARPVAGDRQLGETFLSMMAPFMYRKFLDYGAIEEIRAMKKKIDAVIARDDQLLTNLKLGTGGIREIEFFIQALQLINAGKKPGLRERNSLTALEKLKNEGLLSAGEEKDLREAYLFLRTVEHRLQIFQERQTHTLPSDKAELERLARRAGYRETPLDAFLKDHRAHTEKVRKIYSSLFHEAEKKLEEEKDPWLLELLEGIPDEGEALERLASCGFKEPARALKNLSLLWNGPPFAHFTEKSRRVLRRVAPLILKEIIASPEPDMAINTFESFIGAVGARGTVYSLLAENHHVVRLLVGLFGGSSFLSRILLTYPETLDSLVAPGASSPVKGSDAVKKELGELLRPASDYEDRLDLMRRFRNVEFLRIGINDIYGEIGPDEVSSQLTALADASLDAALSIAIEEVKGRHGVPMAEGGEEARMAVIGMGKLGGMEMTYGSDLDIIFIFDLNGETSGAHGGEAGLKAVTNREFFAKAGQKIISILSVPTREGYVFKVDMRLRPSGSSGALVASLDAFRDYHRESAQTWERQALTRARFVAGDEALGREVIRIIGENIYGRGLGDEAAAEIVHMRKRMEFELAKEGEGIYNVKTGRGGLVDIEFLVQFLLLKHGASNERVRTPGTLLALSRLKEENILSGEDHAVLLAAYRLLRRIENGLRIVHDQSVSRLDVNSRDFEVLARRLGYGSSDLIGEYRARTAAVRAIFKRCLGGPDGDIS